MAGFTAVLLSAGKSQRMGEMKALLNWAGSTLVKYQVATLIDSGAEEVIIVLGHNAELIKPELKEFASVKCVINEEYELGRTTSIKAGIAAVDSNNTDSILFLNVDQPRNMKVISDLVSYHGSSRSKITVPTFNGKGGHPIIFGMQFIPDLLNITEETFGFRSVMSMHDSQIQRVRVSDPGVLWDLNTPEQYAQALLNLGR